ncbi:MAG: right-handed parallel beta-helix repeat-containing protein, partial [Acidimicrobiia bacterium]|nr:right-handed parallel beta-helix repeat-containing protein [Acidimicrobiia bacterium]
MLGDGTGHLSAYCADFRVGLSQILGGSHADVARRRWLTILIAFVLAIPLPLATAQPAGAQTGTFTPVDDAYVDDSNPTWNYGSSMSLRVDSTPLRTSFMKFDVTGIGATSSASIRIYSQSSGDDVSIYSVADTSWDESVITASTAPTVGALIATVGPVENGKSYLLDVSSVVTGDGTYSFALRTTDNTAIKLSSKEGANSPELLVPSPGSPSPFLVTFNGVDYTAASQSGGATHVGTAKAVVEAAVQDLMHFGGGTITFGSGTFDLGGDWFELDSVTDITFEGQGMSLTTLVNNSAAATDTEIFDVVSASGLVIRDMTVAAGGPDRSTSDALDFDDGSNITVERVRVTDSRARGIVFDGKGAGWSADNNAVVDCEIDGVPGDGIEFLASSNNTIDGCVITDVGGHGIQMNKASTSADQPNKQSNNNTIVNVTIDQAGQDGVNINSGDGNSISNAVITNSSDVTSNKDGIRINSANGISCDDNEINNSTITDNQTTKTQRYGLNISSSLCVGTIIGEGNDFSGNRTG